MSKDDFIPGDLESSKFAALKDPYYKALETIKGLGYTTEDYIHNFPCFTGHLTLARYMALIETYQKTLGIAGHMAEIGMYKGAGSMLLTKLSQLYEPHALTQVHGFDWFQGERNVSEEDQAHLIEGAYAEPKSRVETLIKAQGLDNILKVHDMDMTSDAVELFFKEHAHLQFKLVIFDIGIYKVVRNSLPFFWERMTPGGIVIFDQYNLDIAPGETRAVREVLPHAVIRTFPNGWMPTAYVIKD
jgi:hypothetical protein